ncbi:probable RNA-binding protein CG14230 [Drosophila guanche]|uniref:Blast:Probable RNA-binding protein CG14230 n=1 Tax=Drosophila guanche TaxID=7266 RepID=A0A3B0KNI2_DROGU|nr:probable RNA-binding protein CG14230 [Drosophila guanche]SPP86711.1 blast:Probable RNA-binding protein CG14230 [Drosophila guanche]
MSSTRFFLADLPTKATESDLRNLFQDYGHVEQVDLKRKEQEDGPDKIIGFVTLQTDDAHYCLNELNWQKLHGAKLRISVAKESFLDRLKREREENQLREQGQQESESYNESTSRLLKENTQNKRRVFGEDEEIDDDEISPELLITKKRAAHSMHNGKIVIQKEDDVKPLHIIEQYKKPTKQQPDAKVSQAEQKRKESLNKMRQEHLQKKSAIQQALSAITVDGGSSAKRIKFSDAEEDEPEPEERPRKQPKLDLFDDDDDDGEDDDEQVIIPQYEGKKGERLVEMQSKQSLDPRFRITATFVDEEEGDYEQEEPQQAEDKPQESERNWQMGILEQVVGRKLTNTSENERKAAKSKKMLRFDPANEGHQKLVRQKVAPEQEVTTKKTKDVKTKDKGAVEATVSKEAFYVVTDSLTQSLNMRGEGFSLLDMFGSAHDEEVAKRQGQLEKLGSEKILVSKPNANKLGHLATQNPFSYDSSESEDEEATPQAAVSKDDPANEENTEPPKKKSKQKKPKIQMESFFIPKNDPRLKEGAKFFRTTKAEVDHSDYDKVKSRLKLLIGNKIAKTRKNLPSKDIKQPKNKNPKIAIK